MTRTHLFVATALMLLAGRAIGQAAERPVPTGSHIGTGANRIAVVNLNADSEIAAILKLIEEGQDQAALQRAEAYVAGLAVVKPGDESVPATTRYFALNALCIAQTRVRAFDDAIATCNEAIRLLPGQWTAINSRGTALFAAGQYQEALASYEAALAAAAGNDAPVATIQHNIDLARDRIGTR